MHTSTGTMRMVSYIHRAWMAMARSSHSDGVRFVQPYARRVRECVAYASLKRCQRAEGTETC